MVREDTNQGGELESFAKPLFKQLVMDKLITKIGNKINPASSEYDFDEYEKYDKRIDLEIEKHWVNKDVRAKFVELYKRKTGAISPDEIAKAVKSGEINFSNNNPTCTLGGCNTGGYEISDGQDVFSTELATKVDIVVYSSQGYTAPVNGTSKRVSDGTWVETNGDGQVTDLNKETIDLTQPK